MGSKNKVFESSEDVVFIDDHSKPAHLEDCPKEQGKKLMENNLAKEGNEAQPIFWSTSLSVELEWALLDLLKDLKDVFGWTYIEMPGLDP